MADYIDQIYAAKRNANTNALKQRRDEQLAQYDTQGTQDTQAYNQGLPQFQNDMNQADVGAFQDTQRLAERSAQSGNYNGGQTDSNLARIMQTASNNKAGFKNQENQFKQNYANNQNTLAGSRARANNAYSGDIASSNMGIDAEIAQARAQQAEQQQAQRAAAASRARSSAAKAPSAAKIKAANKAEIQTELSRQISAAVQGGMLPSEIQANMGENLAYFKEAGFTEKDLNDQAYRAYQDWHSENAGYTPM